MSANLRRSSMQKIKLKSSDYVKTHSEFEFTMLDEITTECQTAILSCLNYELKTSLNNIIGFSQLLKQDEVNLNCKQKEYIQIVLNSGSELLRLIEQKY